MINGRIIDIGIKKARQSVCRFKISAIGLNKKGEVIYTTCNSPRFSKKNGGYHAEMKCMKNAGPSLETIIIFRINNNGDLLPIEPCDMCSTKAKENGIKILTLKQ